MTHLLQIPFVTSDMTREARLCTLHRPVVVANDYRQQSACLYRSTVTALPLCAPHCVVALLLAGALHSSSCAQQCTNGVLCASLLICLTCIHALDLCKAASVLKRRVYLTSVLLALRHLQKRRVKFPLFAFRRPFFIGEVMKVTAMRCCKDVLHIR